MDYQIIGGPSWQNADHFDITAKASDGKTAPDDITSMVKTLLADRFRLVVRSERRDLPIYALMLARADGKLGPQLRQSSTDCDGPRPTAPPSGRPYCGIRNFFGNISAGAVTMERFVTMLTRPSGRPVFDQTGLAGRFDLDLLYQPDANEFPGFNPALIPPNGPIPLLPSDSPAIFTAIQDQLGLKLASTTGPVDVLVIDHVEHPTED
jgi:uncharacterized protein (TIGR03435 family)